MSALLEKYDAALSGDKLLGGVALYIIGAVLWAHTIHALWGWFLLPLGAPTIGLAHAYGLFGLAKALTWGYADLYLAVEAQPDGGLKRMAWSGIALPLASLAMGYVVANWIGI
jgi:hypothetical protein